MTILEFHTQYGTIELEKQRGRDEARMNSSDHVISPRDLSSSMQDSDKRNKSSMRLTTNNGEEIIDDDGYSYEDTEDGNSY